MAFLAVLVDATKQSQRHFYGTARL